MAADYVLKIEAGSTYRLMVERNAPRLDQNGDVVRGSDGRVIYDPVDMTNWHGHMQIRTEFGGDVVVDITENAGGTDGFLTFFNGKWSILIHEASTFSIKEGFVFDVFAWPTGGDIDKLLRGTTDVEPAATL